MGSFSLVVLVEPESESEREESAVCVTQCYLFVRGCCGCDAVLPLVRVLCAFSRCARARGVGAEDSDAKV